MLERAWADDGTGYGGYNEIPMVTHLVDYSPKGTTVVATGDSIIGHLKATTNHMYASYRRNGIAFTYARFGPIDTMYAVGCSDKSIDLVGAKSAQRLRNIPCGFVPDRISFTTDCTRMIVSGHGSGTVKVIQLSTGNVVQTFAADDKVCVDMTLSTNDSLLATVGGDGTGRIWSMARGEQLYTIRQVGGKGLTTGLAFSHDRTRLATGERGYLAIWVLPGIAYVSSDVSDATWSIESIDAPILPQADTIDFHQVAMGERRDTVVEIVLKNRSDHPITVTDEKIIGADASMFSIRDEELSYTILPGETRSTELRYTPSREGVAHAQMLFEYSEAGSPAMVELKGEGMTSLDVPSEAGQSAASLQMVVTPNPATASATIDFILNRGEDVRIVLTDESGRDVVVIADRGMEPGQQSIHVDLSGLASGQYYCVVSSRRAIATRTFQVVR